MSEIKKKKINLSKKCKHLKKFTFYFLFFILYFPGLNLFHNFTGIDLFSDSERPQKGSKRVVN